MSCCVVGGRYTGLGQLWIVLCNVNLRNHDQAEKVKLLALILT